IFRGTVDMAPGAAIDDILRRERAPGPAAPAGTRPIEIAATHRLEDVAPVWRALTVHGIESPGQQLDFIRLWIDALAIPARDRIFVTAHLDGAPLALLPLQRRWDKGVRVLSWFPGPHVGCNAPLVDVARLQTLSAADRRRLWIKLLRSIAGADVVYMKAVPQLMVDGVDLFAELGQHLEAETL